MYSRRSILLTLFLASGATFLPSKILYGNTSECQGVSNKGSLTGGKALPWFGSNFRPYSYLGPLLQRTYVHEKVRDAISLAYETLAKENVEHTFVYGESGWPGGGSFKPHKSHQNGRSVDFMVPVRGSDGQVVTYPSYPWNKFGYALEFNSEGRLNDLRIDWDAIAQHLLALDDAAKKVGIGIRFVIFEPSYHRFFAATRSGEELLRNVKLHKEKVWIRHDEHYHVEFDVRCRG